MEYSKAIFVYQTNSLGTIQKGNAHYAKRLYNAKLGVAVGLDGNAYAVPTKSSDGVLYNLRDIKRFIDGVINMANKRPDTKFLVTAFTEFSNDDIGPMFALAPPNMKLPYRYKPYVIDNNDKDRFWFG